MLFFNLIITFFDEVLTAVVSFVDENNEIKVVNKYNNFQYLEYFYQTEDAIYGFPLDEENVMKLNLDGKAYIMPINYKRVDYPITIVKYPILGSEGFIVNFNLGSSPSLGPGYWDNINYSYKGINKNIHINDYVNCMAELNGKLYVFTNHTDFQEDDNGAITDTKYTTPIYIVDMETNTIEDKVVFYSSFVRQSFWPNVIIFNDKIIISASEGYSDQPNLGEGGLCIFDTKTHEIQEFNFTDLYNQYTTCYIKYVKDNKFHVVTGFGDLLIFDYDLI